MSHALRNHQTIDAVGGEIFHVAVEQTRAFAIEYTVAITDDSADRRARSARCDLSNSFWNRTKIWLRLRVRLTHMNLIWERELLHCDLVLIGMSGPGTIHQTVGFVLLVFGEHAECAFIQFGIGAAGIKSRHTTNRKNP